MIKIAEKRKGEGEGGKEGERGKWEKEKDAKGGGGMDRGGEGYSARAWAEQHGARHGTRVNYPTRPNQSGDATHQSTLCNFGFP